MFTSYPIYALRRALKLRDPVMTGEDVYALQSALNSINGAGLTADGVLGKQTAIAIKNYQTARGLDADKIAGSATQRQLATDICQVVSDETKVRMAAIHGQAEFESGFWLGIYSPLHQSGTPQQSWDSGLVQENSRVVFGNATTLEERVKRAFTPLTAVHDLALRIIEYRTHFTNITTKRRLQLAQGAWNAPAWACHIAYDEGAKNDWVAARKSDTLTDDQRQTIETYMDHVSVYYI